MGPEVEELLKYLISANGGDGAGAATWNKEKKAWGTKGEKTGAEEIFKLLGSGVGDERGWLFHARMASSGGKNDALNQPFAGERFLFVHNGHWTGWEQAYWGLVGAGKLDVMHAANDSFTISRLVEAAGPGVLWKVGSGVYIVWGKKAECPVLYLMSGEFCYSGWGTEKKGIVYASSFPSDWPVKVYEFTGRSVVELRPEGPVVKIGEEPKKRGRWARRGYSYGYGVHCPA